MKAKQLTNVRASGKDEADPPDPAAPPDARTGHRLHRRRRTGGSDAEVHPPAQAGAEPSFRKKRARGPDTARLRRNRPQPQAPSGFAWSASSARPLPQEARASSSGRSSRQGACAVANDIDLHLGRRLRRRRRLLGLTQQQLAVSVGIRFQQIQKYECGANRISAARLWQLAEALEVPVSYFYDGVAETQARAEASAEPPLGRGHGPQGDHGPDPRLLSAGRTAAPPPAGPGQIAAQRTDGLGKNAACARCGGAKAAAMTALADPRRPTSNASRMQLNAAAAEVDPAPVPRRPRPGGQGAGRRLRSGHRSRPRRGGRDPRS